MSGAPLPADRLEGFRRAYRRDLPASTETCPPDERVQFAFEYGVELVQCQVDAMVSDPALRKIVGADALRAISAADEAATDTSLLLVLSLALGSEEAGLEQGQSLGAIFVL